MKKNKKQKIPNKLKSKIFEGLERDKKRIEQYKKEHRKFLTFFFSVVYHIKIFLQKNKADNINALAGQSAFFIVLSIIPFVMFILSLITMLGGNPNSDSLQRISNEGSVLTPAQSEEMQYLTEFLKRYILETFQQASSGLTIVTAVIALWSAGKGLYIITDGISRIYGIEPKRLWVIRRIYAMGYTAVLLVMILVYLFLMILNFVVDDYLKELFGEFTFVTGFLYGFRYIIASVLLVLLMTLALKLFLRNRIADKRFIKFRVLLPGMIFTAIAWGVLTWGIGLYSRYFSSSLYGSLGSVFLFLMWIYFMMLLLLYGIQINYIYREQFYAFRLRDIFSAVKRRRKAEEKKKAAS